MNRRGFLSFLPAAVVGGRAAAAEVAERLALPAESDGIVWQTETFRPRRLGFGDYVWGSDSLAETREALASLLDPESLSKRRRDTEVRRLDPDIATMSSWSLSRKILAQRDRNYDREVERKKADLLQRIERLLAEGKSE